MTAFEFFAKYPDIAQAYRQANSNLSTPIPPEQFLYLWATRNPHDTRASELDPGLFAPDSNTRSYQSGDQTGTFESSGDSSQTQRQVQDQTGQQTTSQNTTQSGLTTGLVSNAGQTNEQSTGESTTTQQQRGTTQQQQTGTTEVLDRLGLGSLLQGAAPAASAADTTRQGFLTDLVENGGRGLQDNVTRAVNYSLSGPGMQGIGDAAKGRVAGSAVADVIRNDTAQRLAASQQLAGPSATTNVVSAGAPFLGQQTSQNTTNISDLVSQASQLINNQSTANTQNTQRSNEQTTGNTATSGESNTTQQNIGVSDLVSKEKQSGTSTGQTTQSGFGEQPTQSGGGCYISSVCALHGRIGLRVLRRCVKFKLSKRRFRHMLVGYSIYGHFFARQVEKRWNNGGLASAVVGICRAILYQELRWSGVRLRFKLWPWFAHWLFHYGSTVVGFCSTRRSVVTPVSDLSQRMQKANLFFKETF